MQAYVITIKNNYISEKASKELKQSSEFVGNKFKIETFNAVTPTEVDLHMDWYNLEWNYPWKGSVKDHVTKLVKTAYPTVNKDARIACSLSHYKLWHHCIELNEPLLIFEHDTWFHYKFESNQFLKEHPNGCLGINSPFGATRKPAVFDRVVQHSNRTFVPCPKIDKVEIPQGLAGNSAYLITPNFASRLVDNIVPTYGLWPNDAIMNWQLLPDMYVTKKYYTSVQGTRSTTTL